MELLMEIIRSAIPSTIPVLLVALGGSYSYHANVFNIAMEGMLLVSAFFAVAISYATGSWLLGLIFAIIGSVAISLLFSLFTIYLKTGEFITGIAINMFVAGGTTYFLRQIFNVKGALISTKIQALPRLEIPFIGKIPFLGPILDSHNILVYIGILIVVPLVYIHLYKTRFGLRLRATGFDYKVVDSVGIKSDPIKLKAVILGGILCGLGGASLSLGYMKLFTENMSAGRGWIALAIIILTKGHPIGIFVLSFMFGLFEGVGLSLQGFGVPNEFTQMLPYISTIVVLYIYSVKDRGKKQRLSNNAA
ncbi:MAG: ABC transporter permease [Clostridiaceae bacterium]|nr:ABC transporter permease [Clostridiaceae bacterium]